MCIVFFVGIIVYSGILLSGTDLWDGVIISHAFDTKQYFIYHNWFTESGWPLVPYMYDLFIFSGNEKLFIYSVLFVIIIFHIFSSLEIIRLTQLVFKFNGNDSLLGGILFLISPGWALYYSSVFLMHSMTIFIALHCVRRMLEGKNIVLYSLLSFISFQQSSNPILIFSILIINAIISREITLSKLKFEISYILSAIVFFLISRELFKSSGLYVDYNKISISNLLDFSQYANYFKYFLHTNSFLIIFFIILCSYAKDKKLLISGGVLLGGLILNAIPYVSVGKVPLYYEINNSDGYSLRFSFTGVFLFSFLFSVFLNKIENAKIKFICAFIILGQALYLNFAVQQSKLKSMIYQQEFIKSLEELDYLPECTIILNEEGVGFHPAFYELNYIFNKAYGDTLRLPLSSGMLEPNSLANFKKLFVNPIYRAKYILPEKYPDCMVKLNINSKINSMAPFDVFLWYINYGNSRGGLVSIEQP